MPYPCCCIEQPAIVLSCLGVTVLLPEELTFSFAFASSPPGLDGCDCSTLSQSIVLPVSTITAFDVSYSWISIESNCQSGIFAVTLNPCSVFAPTTVGITAGVSRGSLFANFQGNGAKPAEVGGVVDLRGQLYTIPQTIAPGGQCTALGPAEIQL